MIIPVNEVRYHLQVVGDGPPLLLLHGFTGDMTQWDRFIKSWQEKYKVITLDIIGHGMTKAPDDVTFYQMDTVADQIIALLRDIDVESINILGYSMGGRLALTIAERYPDRVKTLLLESASPGLKTKEEREKRKESDYILAQKIVSEGTEAFVDYWQGIPLFQSQEDKLSVEQKARLRAQRLQNDPRGLANSLKGMGTGSQRPLWDKLSTLPMSVLLVVGEQDLKFMSIAKEMTNLLKNGEMISVADVGHAVHMEVPTFFDKIVRETFFNMMREGNDQLGN